MTYFSHTSFSRLLVLGALALTACDPDQLWDYLDTPNGGEKAPALVTFQQQGLYPEGVEYDTDQDAFLVSSLTQGTIGRVTNEGTYSPFIESEQLISTIGLHIDAPRKRLLVAISNPGVSVRASQEPIGQYAALGLYDLLTGQEINVVRLSDLMPGQPHFANDIAVDNQGNAYITDSFSPIIYKVTQAGEASIFLQDSTFSTPAGAFGLNGIDFDPRGGGYLIAGFSYTNTLYRIPLSNPQAFAPIALDVAIPAPDGITLSKNHQQLIVVGNAGGTAPGKVFTFASQDGWKSATATETFTSDPVFPTTVAQRKNQFYVLYAYLNQLFGGDPTHTEYQIKQLPF
ncbi:hypothetical protein SAMN05421823_109259 [Catalinimonas alkaloidigena]|uniref:SMP-30/Gluconolaconase/LRE-like region-containing protein n=1 Tax=Catalinimonas alkaloidigena TaxID=1075417 RepID=A0A1G9PPE9_9BACT|nr:hypothetical protein [Catalinimonas alkaloidigena]SDM00718.1 hypothetical protein SAMN05421823_109259 [Catalinimonas alkaloidigena]